MSDPFAKEKLYEALDFFSRNVKYAGKVKLFKLLYYLDLMVLRRTGKTVTGLRYEAWPMGPVPVSLDQQFGDPASELHQRFEIKEHQKIESEILVNLDTDEEQLETYQHSVHFIPSSVRSRTPYTHRFLTLREQGIAKLIAEVFYEAKASDMSDISHNKFGPWQKAIMRAKKEGLDRPEVNLMEGVVAVGNKAEELPLEELKELVEDRERLRQALC
jgi:uncharacterized phage-associated protein